MEHVSDIMKILILVLIYIKLRRIDEKTEMLDNSGYLKSFLIRLSKKVGLTDKKPIVNTDDELQQIIKHLEDKYDADVGFTTSREEKSLNGKSMTYSISFTTFS